MKKERYFQVKGKRRRFAFTSHGNYFHNGQDWILVDSLKSHKQLLELDLDIFECNLEGEWIPNRTFDRRLPVPAERQESEGNLPPDRVKPRFGVKGRDIYPSVMPKESFVLYSVAIPTHPNRRIDDEENNHATTLPFRK